MKRVEIALIMNPWSSFGFLRVLTGLKDWQLLQALADNSLIDRVVFPVHHDLIKGHNKVALYNLTSRGGQQVGRFQNIGKNTMSLTLSYYRLTRVRQIVCRLLDTNLLAWLISPWWPGRLDAPIDALMGIKPEADGGVFLFAQLVAPPSASAGWYIDQLRNWRRAKARYSRLKAVQLMLLSDGREKPLQKEGVVTQEDNVCFLASDEDVKRYILRHMEMKRLSSKNELHYIPEHFLHRMPHNPVKGYRNLKSWLEEDQSARAHILRKCMQLSAREIEVLWMIARYPAVSLQDMSAAGMIKLGARSQRRLLRSLQDNNVIVAIKELPNSYCINELGLQVVSALHGVGADFMNVYLGNPLRQGMFVHQNEHNRSVQDFMFALSRAGVLLDWQYMTQRYEFTKILIPGRQVGEKRIVYPDSTGTIKTSSGQYFPFWLELDRATRRGRRRIRTQIEKYFAIHYARQPEIFIPPLLYVVATQQSSESARLRQVIGCFQELAVSQFPSNQLIVLFAAGKVLAQNEDEILRSPLWMFYHQGRVLGSPVSLEQGLARAHSLRHSARLMESERAL